MFDFHFRYDSLTIWDGKSFTECQKDNNKCNRIVADNNCDEKNNNIQCDYDGGECTEKLGTGIIM